MDLNILDHRLRIASIKKEDAPRFMHDLIRIGLLSLSGCRFFTLTITSEDYTLVMDQNLYEDLTKKGNLKVAPGIWIPLSVSAGAYSSVKVSGISNIAKSLIIPLADAQVSIFCLSSYQTDYILVEEKDLETSINCLSSKADLRQLISQLPCTVPLDKLPEPNKQADKCRPITHSFNKPTNKFHITSVDRDNQHLAGLAIIQQLFYPKCPDQRDSETDQFFSYSNVDGYITLVMDTEAFEMFPENSVYVDDEYWRMIKIGGQEDDLGFSEYGIVAQVSDPIADANIQEYYISTFLSGCTLVPETSLEATISLLNSRLELSRTPSQDAETVGPGELEEQTTDSSAQDAPKSLSTATAELHT